MALIQEVHLKMASFRPAPVIPTVQNDTNRSARMIIDDFTLQEGMTGKLSFKRSDGTYYEIDAELELQNNSFQADLAQALTQPGRTMAQLKVYDGEDVISTYTFTVFVEEDATGQPTYQETINLSKAIKDAEDAKTAAEDAAKRAEDAAETLEIDSTLTSATKAAQAKAVGDAINKLKDDLTGFVYKEETDSGTASLIFNIDIPISVKSGDKLKFVLDSYDGDYLHGYRVFLYKADDSYVYTSSMLHIGDIGEYDVTDTYVRGLFQIVRSTAETGTKATFRVLIDKGISKSIFDIADSKKSEFVQINGQKQVKVENTTFMSAKNMYDISGGYTSGIYYNSATPTENANYFASNPMYGFEVGQTYAVSRAGGGEWSAFITAWDNYGNFISSQSVGTFTGLIQTFTVPVNTAYIRVSAGNANRDILQIEKGSTVTGYENHNFVHLNVELAELQDVAKASDVVTADVEIPDSVLFYNVGYYFSTDGTTLENAGGTSWCVSDYIPVGLGCKVTGSSYSSYRPQIVEYDSNKNFIGMQKLGSIGSVTKEYTPTMGVSYVRLQSTISTGNIASGTQKIAEPTPMVYHVEKDGSGDFTSLVDAIAEATRRFNAVVYVGAGTWDILDELGADYLADVSATKQGIVLKNRVHVICSSKAYIKCLYSGSDANVINYLSAFNAGKYGFTLENADIEVANVRYCVHDERNAETDHYDNYYINCRMKNTNQKSGSRSQCIGGGLGYDGHIIIDGCTFENPLRDNYGIVSYHNAHGAATDSRSLIEVKGCYFYGTNTFRAGYYGNSLVITPCLIHGNSMGDQPYMTQEDPNFSNINMEIVAWNNEIRS